MEIGWEEAQKEENKREENFVVNPGILLKFLL